MMLKKVERGLFALDKMMTSRVDKHESVTINYKTENTVVTCFDFSPLFTCFTFLKNFA